GGGRHVLFHPWGRRFPEARSGWPHHGYGFHPRPDGRGGRGGLRRSRILFPDMGAGTAERLRCGGAGAVESTPVAGGEGMMAGHDETIVGGGPARHIPVLLSE